MKTYLEQFDNGPAGWWGWSGNAEGLKRLEMKDGSAISRSPWWIDYNHAPPGVGYIHMLFCLNTKGPPGEQMKEVAGSNAFTNNKFPVDFTNARLTFRIKGEFEPRGANVVLLIQAAVGDTITGWMLTGQPLRVTPDWTEQTITAVPDEKQWTCLGSRHDRTDYYGRTGLKQILGDVNVNIMLVAFPVNVVPMGPIEGDPHILRPAKDYPVWMSRLPEGYIKIDTVKIEFAG